MPKTAVIIPAYNEEAHISNVLNASIKWHKNDPKNRSVIVVDDGSKDRTVKIALKPEPLFCILMAVNHSERVAIWEKQKLLDKELFMLLHKAVLLLLCWMRIYRLSDLK